MTDNTPSIGVVGVGHLGRHHVKHLSNNNDALLAGIYDIDYVRVQDIAEEFNCRVFNSLNNLLDECDALVIVTHTPSHAAVAAECIKARKHVFIEKPITKTVAEADHLLQLAKKNNVFITPGSSIMLPIRKNFNFENTLLIYKNNKTPIMINIAALRNKIAIHDRMTMVVNIFNVILLF